MKKIFALLSILALASSVNGASTLWEFYGGNLPSISERAVVYKTIGDDVYRGLAEQNIRLLSYLQSYNGTQPFGDLGVGADNFTPVGGVPYRLSGSGVASTDTSIGLTSFKQPISNLNLTMTNFGTIGYGTI